MVKPHKTGDLTVGTVGLTENYRYQVFFDLETNTGVSKNLISAWDLGFESSDSGWHVILNSAKMMTAGNSMNIDFDAVTGEEEINMVFDPSDKTVDSTAVGEWYYYSSGKPVSFGYTYIIDRGSDESGNPEGKKKAQFGIQADGSYLVRSADISGSNEKTDVFEKDSGKNFVCYSFDNGVVIIEPEKENWDLLFTKYSTMLVDNGRPLPYLVTGVLLNPYKVEANIDTLNVFDEITLEHAWEFKLTNRKDIIGYDWKTYSFDNRRYTVDSDKVYIVRDNAGFYYKLRFVDFYNATDEKGYPTFEYIKL